MRILVSNDDGINAKGIRVLVAELRSLGEVTVVAPETERSAVGHAITLSDPLRVKEVRDNGELFGYSVNGTPSDCVKIAINALLPDPPDLVVSGVNLGANVATDVIYSGTVSAATEGTIMGVPSIAVSLNTFTNPDFRPAARFARLLAEEVLERGLPERTLLNVNVPNLPLEEIKGVVVTRQGKSRFVETFHKRIDPRNNTYYWQAGEMVVIEEGEDVDVAALRAGNITVTPIHYDLTNYAALDVLRAWDLGRLLRGEATAKKVRPR
ncbi:MAG TPA: 5'/3'-nucleotidase SurE [Thermodesulfobacteriota bacterium]|nr:5'/3'-nucleotidase SurE [Thermodesulfobacteriota bacterium]